KKKKAPEPFSSLTFVVLRESDGRPVKNASVVLHLLRQDGSQEREGLQLKTNADGRASIEDIPYGKLRLQVVAHRLQTYGDDVEVNQAKQELVIPHAPGHRRERRWKPQRTIARRHTPAETPVRRGQIDLRRREA